MFLHHTTHSHTHTLRDTDTDTNTNGSSNQQCKKGFEFLVNEQGGDWASQSHPPLDGTKGAKTSFLQYGLFVCLGLWESSFFVFPCHTTKKGKKGN
jgi:hypothetical protein